MSNGALTPSGSENLGAFSLNVYFLGLKTSFEREVDYGFHQSFTTMRRDQFVLVAANLIVQRAY